MHVRATDLVSAKYLHYLKYIRGRDCDGDGDGNGNGDDEVGGR
jgi:hypothetical protein